MHKLALLVVASVLATTCGVCCAATPTTAGRGPAAPAHVDLNATLLFSQTAGGNGIGIVSQNFESAYAQYDSADADAFTVPASPPSGWHVRRVVANGVYFNGAGPATSEDVTFYKDAGGHPGAIRCSYPGRFGADTNGSFSIQLTPPPGGCHLLANHKYWVSVVVNMAFGTGGEWGWLDAADLGMYQADWENPGGGFGICPTWTAELTCIPDGQANGKNYQLYH